MAEEYAELVPGVVVVLGLDWSNDGARLRVRRLGEDASEMVSARGLRLRFGSSELGRRQCLGHVERSAEGSTYVECLKAPAESGGRQCSRCQTVDAVHASRMHQAHRRDRALLDRSLIDHLAREHWLYLATFRDGSIKVGTSVDRRKHLRLVEQGAWRARLVARSDDGYAVRDAEDRATEEHGLGQAVPAARKLAGLITPVDDDALLAQLDQAGEWLSALLDRMADPQLTSVSEDWTFPGHSDPLWNSRLVKYPLDLATGAHDLRIIDLCGRIAIVEGPADRFAVDIAALFGREIELGDIKPDELTVQGALF